MSTRPARENGRRAFRLQAPAANGKVGGDAPDARRAWLTTFWGHVLRRFRDHEHGADAHATGGGRREMEEEEDR